MEVQTLLYYLMPNNIALKELGVYQRQSTRRWLPTLRGKGGIVKKHAEVQE